MSRFSLFRIKNAMLIANFISNVIGVSVVLFLTHKSLGLRASHLVELSRRINLVFYPVSFILPIVLTLLYERPIRRHLDSLDTAETLPAAAILEARRRLLNEPFFLIALAFTIWFSAALIYAGMFWTAGAGFEVIRGAFLRRLYTGLIYVTVGFFVFEFVLQRRVVPYLFPNGGLSSTPGTLRIRIRTRLVALLMASNLVPLMIILDDVSRTYPATSDPYQSVQQLQTAILSKILVFVATGLWLTFLVSNNLTKPLEQITQVLRKIKLGRFEDQVRVTSNDEIGYTGDVINEMTEGLLERDRMQQSLALAREIQNNLLPREDLNIAGIEIAGRSLYCDETGGDYYDFIRIEDAGRDRIGVVVADVSGHGISSALLMATVRSSLRQRASLPGDSAQIITGVNRQLVHDVEHSGDFVTMFFLTIDPASRALEWVRAGHDPALLYDPATDSFEELNGPGLALGINEDWPYQASTRNHLAAGQVIFIGTDGIWELQNQYGDPLGKQAVRDAIRENHAADSQTILTAVLDSLIRYQNGAKQMDDITLVIIKAAE